MNKRKQPPSHVWPRVDSEVAGREAISKLLAAARRLQSDLKLCTEIKGDCRTRTYQPL